MVRGDSSLFRLNLGGGNFRLRATQVSSVTRGRWRPSPTLVDRRAFTRLRRPTARLRGHGRARQWPSAPMLARCTARARSASSLRRARARRLRRSPSSSRCVSSPSRTRARASHTSRRQRSRRARRPILQRRMTAATTATTSNRPGRDGRRATGHRRATPHRSASLGRAAAQPAPAAHGRVRMLPPRSLAPMWRPTPPMRQTRRRRAVPRLPVRRQWLHRRRTWSWRGASMACMARGAPSTICAATRARRPSCERASARARRAVRNARSLRMRCALACPFCAFLV